MSATTNVGALGGYWNYEIETYNYLTKQDWLGEGGTSEGTVWADPKIYSR